MNEDKDWVGQHLVITRSALIAVVACAVLLVARDSANETLIEYVFWAVVFMFSAILFGDKMLVQVKDIVKAWKGT